MKSITRKKMTKQPEQDFSKLRIFILIGAIGAAIATAILGFIFFATKQAASADTNDPENQKVDNN